jgi:hypothetical protein
MRHTLALRSNLLLSLKCTPPYQSAIGDCGQTVAVPTPHLLFAENPAYEIGGVFRAKFLHDVPTVEFDGARTDAEHARGLLAGCAAHDLSQRYAFPRRQ